MVISSNKYKPVLIGLGLEVGFAHGNYFYTIVHIILSLKIEHYWMGIL